MQWYRRASSLSVKRTADCQNGGFRPSSRRCNQAVHICERRAPHSRASNSHRAWKMRIVHTVDVLPVVGSLVAKTNVSGLVVGGHHTGINRPVHYLSSEFLTGHSGSSSRKTSDRV